MAKLLKQYLRNEVQSLLADQDGAVVVHYQGLNSKKEYDFRKELRDRNAKILVVKASVARVHLKEEGYTGEIDEILTGPVAFVVSREGGEGGTTKVAKAMLDVVKTYPKIKVRGALFDGTVVDKDGVDSISKMPTREQLLSRLAGAFKAPNTRFASSIKAINTKFASVLSALQKKKESDEG